MDIFILFQWLERFTPQFIEFHIKGNIILLGLSVVIFFNYKKPALIKFISSISILEIILILPSIMLFQLYFFIPDTSATIILDTFTFNFSTVPDPSTSLFGYVNIKTILLVFYLIGLSIIMGKLLRQYLRLILLSRKSVVTDKIALRFRTIKVKVTDYYHSPYTFGIFKPVILLPKSFEMWSEIEKQIALKHELTHIRQFDMLINLFMSIIAGFFYYNPLSWWIIARLDLAIENMCDSRMCTYQNLEPKNYARFLLDIAESLRDNVNDRKFQINLLRAQSQINSRIYFLINPKEVNRLVPNKLKIVMSFLFLVSFSFPLGCQTEMAESTVNEEISNNPTMKITTVSANELKEIPKVLKQVPPKYPEIARKEGISGKVIIEIVVNDAGKVEKAEVIESIKELDQAALDAVKLWEFEKPQKDGKPIKVEMIIPIQFKLQ